MVVLGLMLPGLRAAAVRGAIAGLALGAVGEAAPALAEFAISGSGLRLWGGDGATAIAALILKSRDQW